MGPWLSNSPSQYHISRKKTRRKKEKKLLQVKTMSSEEMEKQPNLMDRNKTHEKSGSELDNEGTTMMDSGNPDLFANNNPGKPFGFGSKRRAPGKKPGPRNRYSSANYSDF